MPFLGDTTMKIPENHFMKWFKDCMNEGHIQFNFRASDERYLSDFIKREDILSWKPGTPVFISAQTGAGKNWFVLHVLIRNLIRENHERNTHEKILLLSNRVALNRQNKFQIVDFLMDYESRNFAKNFDSYTENGIDSILRTFGCVYIYSYKQLLTDEQISSQRFKYIICDECHYFTSDPPFDIRTQDVLEKIVNTWKDAIHIYMSATPNVVFESIVRSEYNVLQQAIEKMIQDRNTSLAEASKLDFTRLNKARDEATKKSRQSKNEKIDVDMIQGYFYNDILQEEIQQISSQYDSAIASACMPILFYYQERKYDYINRVFFYRDKKELSEKIVHSLNNDKEKWLIFVREKTAGNDLVKEINGENNKENPPAIFIDADSRRINGDQKETFDYIVQNESFSQRILISTSTLDNGINIKDENVANVVIDVFDREEFLQMLGRIRISTNDGANQRINLFVRDYDDDDLNTLMKSHITELLYTLQLDTLSIEECQRIFNDSTDQRQNPERKGWRYDHVTGEFKYNPNRVYHFINSAQCIMSYLKNRDPSYQFSFPSESHDIRVTRSAVYKYCRNNNEGKSKSWSRSIIDLIELPDDARERQAWIHEDMKRGIENRYGYTFNDTFSRYIYEVAVPEFYDSKITERILQERKHIEPSDFRKKPNVDACRDGNTIKVSFVPETTEFDRMLKLVSQGRELTRFEVLCHLKDYLENEGISRIDISMEQKFDEKSKWYHSYANNKNFTSPVDMYGYWLELDNIQPTYIRFGTEEPAYSTIDIEKERQDFFETTLKNSIVSMENIEKYKHMSKDKTPTKYHEKEYLDKYGIKKGSTVAEKVERLYGIKLLKDNIATIMQNEYKICSYRDHTEKHETYYILHPINNVASAEENVSK